MRFREVRWTWLMVGLVLLPCAFPTLTGALEYDRQSVARGELWRLATCHLVHFGGDHLTWNLMSLIVLGLACERRGRPRYVACTLVGGLSISLALLVLDPGLTQYRGYSGVGSAVFANLGIQVMVEARRNGRVAWMWLVATVFVSFLVKLQFEQATGRAFFAKVASADMETVPLAHAVGAITGLACAIWPFGDRPPCRPPARVITLDRNSDHGAHPVLSVVDAQEVLSPGTLEVAYRADVEYNLHRQEPARTYAAIVAGVATTSERVLSP